MPHIISKPIIMIAGSRSIKALNISNYIRPSSIGAVISGGASGVDYIAERWAKSNKIEFVCYPANWKVFGKKAGMMRNVDMINACDIAFFFWDSKSPGTKQGIDYCNSIGRKYFVHIIEQRD